MRSRNLIIDRLDHLHALLLRIATDLAVDPSTSQLRRDGAWSHALRPDAVRAHAAHSDFMVALASEPEVSPIFPDDDETRGIERPYRPRNVAHNLINAVLWHAELHGWRDSETLTHELQNALALFYRLAKTGRLTGTTVTGISGTLPAGTEIETKWGILSDARGYHEVLKRSLIGDRDQVVDRWCVLESPTKIHWEVKPGEKVRQDQLQGFNETGARQVALAIMLTKGPDNYRPSTPWFSTRMNPLLGGVPGGGWRSRVIEGPAVSDAELTDLTGWLTKLGTHQFSEISIDRVMTMISRNVEHVDAFIDAVIIWENLFSAGQIQELSYRVSLNMACVLSDDSTERARLQREIKGLYDLRSKVVHGVTHLSDIDGRDVRLRAQHLTIVAMQRLLAKHPLLVQGQPDRFMRFVLGVPGSSAADT